MTVTASISTKDRYFTTLPLAIAGICAQTVKPKQLVIFDDGEMRDLRGVSPYSHLFPLLMSKGIPWFHLHGGRSGQVKNHQTALDLADTDMIWRLDDDNAPEPDCLKNLLKAMEDPSVGAVGGLVHDPKSVSPRPSFVTGRIEDILNPFNLQWYQWSGSPEEVDHLYSTFLYRVDAGRKAGGYSRALSPVGHREETMFSHQIKRAGYKLLVTPDALTWHFRESTGGIRSYTDGSLWAQDEQVFKAQLAEWGVRLREHKTVVLDNGMGDHIVFRSILGEIIAKNPGHRMILSVCYPEVFEGDPRVTLCSIADAKAAFGDLGRWDIYKFCEERRWHAPLADAFRAMYL
jgi:hypothetical protein